MNEVKLMMENDMPHEAVLHALVVEKMLEIQKLQAVIGRIRNIMHYPECWDAMAYPTLESAIYEAFRCNNDSCEQRIK